MQIILSRLDPFDNIKIEKSIPILESDEGIKDILSKILISNKGDSPLSETIIAEEGNFINYIFENPGPSSTEKRIILMITAVLDEHENPKIFKKEFDEFVNSAKNIPHLTSAFMQSELNSMKYINVRSTLNDLLKDLYKKLEKKMKGKVGLAQIIFLGVQAVGKTTIIQRMITGEFQEGSRPTLAPQVLKLIFEQIDMRVYDVGGQKKLRSNWTQVLVNPHAIVYVIDLAGDDDKHQQSQEEFDRMMNFYFNKNSAKNIPENTPILILGNKKDLNDSMLSDTIEDIYAPSKFMKNYAIHLVSAKTGEGLLESFKWVANEIKITSKR